MKKPYLLTAWDNYYPSGGTEDWIACYETIEAAESNVEPRYNKTKNGNEMLVGYTIKKSQHGDNLQVFQYEIVDLREWTEK